MNHGISTHRKVFLLLYITFFMAGSILITGLDFSVQNPLFNSLIIMDFVLTSPLIYFLIIRKTNIPNYTVGSVTIISIIVAGFVIPNEHQGLLDTVKVIFIPLFELSVLLFLFLSFRKVREQYILERGKNVEFYDVLTNAISQVFPNRIGSLLATEIAVIYYSLFKWNLAHKVDDGFTYYKSNGIVLILYSILGLALIETIVAHLLLIRWNTTLANVITFLSIYSMIQILALIKSYKYRPVYIDYEESKIVLRHGFFTRMEVPFEALGDIEVTSKYLPDHSDVVKLSPLGAIDNHNLIIHFNRSLIMDGFYGKKTTGNKLAIFVDRKEEFIQALRGLDVQ